MVAAAMVVAVARGAEPVELAEQEVGPDAVALVAELAELAALLLHLVGAQGELAPDDVFDLLAAYTVTRIGDL